eukprot:CAMPEP_0194515142 /NCGR_PEP_ID=MMETSP0253-20130528/47740_1 /TAXON_ID=2966 /ORGANISM="Noctiluca scintillans" /LENGTH=101 /DNA_ID=CAMNT_0039358867 /DNA_START=548 /DNA_END=853 /DNA_ORIENTATION=+
MGLRGTNSVGPTATSAGAPGARQGLTGSSEWGGAGPSADMCPSAATCPNGKQALALTPPPQGKQAAGAESSISCVRGSPIGVPSRGLTETGACSSFAAGSP